MELYPQLEYLISSLNFKAITKDKKMNLIEIAKFLAHRIDQDNLIRINYICTHNSRRSQFSQIWSSVASSYFNLPVESYSGGVEITAFNPRAVESLKRMGFEVLSENQMVDNPQYWLKYSEQSAPVVCFSKLFDDISSPKENFITMMTCGHADENCPFIPGALKRISFRFEDPKVFDGTPLEAQKYDERSLEIATELFFIMEQTSKLLN
jgi:arsenate reductase